MRAPATPLFDTKLERALAAMLIATPDLLDHADADFDTHRLFDMHARAAVEAVVNLRGRGEAITTAAVADELVRADKLADRAWFDALTSTTPAPNLQLFRGWTRTIVRHARQREAAIEVEEERQRTDDEMTEVALRDVDFGPERLEAEVLSLEDEREKREQADATPRAKPRWIVPLCDFLGEEEPSDDDREDWIIRDIIPRGEAALIAGPPKGGKTWSMLSLAIDVALGLPWLGTFENTIGQPARVLTLAFEDGQRRLRKRAWELSRARGVTPNDPRLRENLVISREPLRLPDAGDERAFAAELRTWKPSLVIIDNLTRVMVGDQNAIKDAKRFGDTWVKLCTDVGAAVVFLHHTSKVGPLRLDKRNEGDPFELIRGSSDLIAAARQLVLVRPIETDDGRKLSDARMRGNLDLTREDFVLGFERTQREEHWHAQLSDLGDGAAFRAQQAESRRERAEADKKVKLAAEHDRRRELALSIVRAEGAISAPRLAEACGLKSPRAVAPLLADMVRAGVFKTGGNRGYVFADSDGPQ